MTTKRTAIIISGAAALTLGALLVGYLALSASAATSLSGAAQPSAMSAHGKLISPPDVAPVASTNPTPSATVPKASDQPKASPDSTPKTGTSAPVQKTPASTTPTGAKATTPAPSKSGTPSPTKSTTPAPTKTSAPPTPPAPTPPVVVAPPAPTPTPTPPVVQPAPPVSTDTSNALAREMATVAGAQPYADGHQCVVVRTGTVSHTSTFSGGSIGGVPRVNVVAAGTQVVGSITLNKYSVTWYRCVS